MTAPTLDNRTLNRTLLARQGLLRRERRSVREVVGGLVGLQAQEPQNPFVALWSRIDGFDAAELDSLLLDRTAVRTALMRTTLHLVTADDALRLRPLFAPVLARTLQSQRTFRLGLEGVDRNELVQLAARRLAERPMSAAELRPVLAERWPDRDPSVLMMAVRYLVPVVQAPPRGLWRRRRQPTLMTLAGWLGRAPATAGDPEALVVRYLRAFGPATPSDVRTWSWLTGLRPVMDRLRPALRTFRDEAGRTLLDVEDGPIVRGDEPAPVRFLPEYDNVFLSHADRARITTAPPDVGAYERGTVLLDGFVAGGWRIEDGRDDPRLTVRPSRPLTAGERRDVNAEAEGLVTFLVPDAAAPVIRLASP